MKRISFVLLMLFALVLVACTDSQGATPTATPTASPSAASEDSDEQDTSESEAAALPSLDLPGSAPELEALLPDEIGGTETVKFSMGGPELMADQEESGVDPEFIAFLERLGARPEDISIAFAFSFSEEGDSAGIGAFRVAGASSDELEREFMATMETEGDVVDWQSASVAGKDVQTTADPDTEGNTIYVYTAGDIVFFVTTQDEATAAELLEPLP
ncbi:MAG: hypothetical protein LC744_03270 [Chloroflexi bacterium]|nr:hypothetical protein [Chloroflexota bacterium]